MDTFWFIIVAAIFVAAFVGIWWLRRNKVDVVEQVRRARDDHDHDHGRN